MTENSLKINTSLELKYWANINQEEVDRESFRRMCYSDVDMPCTRDVHRVCGNWDMDGDEAFFITEDKQLCIALITDCQMFHGTIELTLLVYDPRKN